MISYCLIIWMEDMWTIHSLQKLCDRHFGIGADGMMACEKSTSCDIKNGLLYQDGSKADMCGNGIRCFSVNLFMKIKLLIRLLFSRSKG